MEVFQGYSDVFEILGNPYGMVINFDLSPPVRAIEQRTPVARIRVSWEMGKVLSYLILGQIKGWEQKMGVSYPIPTEILNQLKIAKEDWDKVWTPPEFDIGG